MIACRAAILVALIAVVAGCSHGPSTAPPPPVTGRPEQVVVLGGDTAFGADLQRDERLRDSWPQLLLAALPPGSSMTDLAAQGATVADITHRQVALAASLHPTIAVVSLDGNGRGADARMTDAAVGSAVDELRAAGAAKVVVVEFTPRALDPSVGSDGAVHGAVVVDGSSVDGSGTRFHQALADLVTTAATRP